MNCKVISGLSSETPKRLLLDAGAFLVNYDPETEDFDEAVQAGKLLGATRGGGSFSAVPTRRSIEVDGARGAIKGLELLDEWEVLLGASVIEVTGENIARALGLAKTEDDTEGGWEVITAKTCLEDSDYLDSVSWVGSLSGTSEPVVIQIFNAVNNNGLTFTPEDKSEGVIEFEFKAHFDLDKIDEVPLKIYYPLDRGDGV